MNAKCFFILVAIIVSQSFQTTKRPAFAAEPTVEVLFGPADPVPTKGSTSDLNNPFAIEFAANGEMIIVEYEGGRVLSWSQKNGLKHLAGRPEAGYQDGEAKAAQFNKLHNLAILDDGSILLSDHLTHTIRKFDPKSNRVSTYSGTGKPGPAAVTTAIAAATYNLPISISLVPSKKSLLVADIGNRRIRRADFESGVVSIVAGNGEKGTPEDGSLATESPLLDPRAAIENEAGEIFLIERNGNALRKIDLEGRISTIAGDGTAGPRDGDALAAQLNGPKHLCFDESGNIFIADDMNHAVRKYDPATKTLTTVDLGDYKISRPHGVCVHEGWLYIADSYQHRVLRVKL
jgi:hypothetical protein